DHARQIYLPVHGPLCADEDPPRPREAQFEDTRPRTPRGAHDFFSGCWSFSEHSTDWRPSGLLLRNLGFAFHHGMARRPLAIHARPDISGPGSQRIFPEIHLIL